MAASVGTARLEVRELETTLRAPWGMRRRHRSAFRLGPLSFDVAPGEAVAVLGPNGAGKTTLLRLLGGIYRPSSGQVEIDGRTSPVIGTWPPFDPDLTVAEHLRSWSALLGGRLDAQAALSFAGLRELETQPVRWLSAGQRVRLGMAPGLLSSCDVYLIDEALAVCDPEFRAQAIDLLRARCESGVTLILAGQDLLTARALCERGLCLDRGRLAMDGELDQAIAAFTVGGGDATDAMATGSVVIKEVTAGPAPTGEPIPIRVRVRGATRPFQLLVAVKDNAGRLFHSSRTVFESSAAAPSGAESLQVVVPPGGLPAGRYRVAVSVVGIDQVPLATRDDATVFEIG